MCVLLSSQQQIPLYTRIAHCIPKAMFAFLALISPYVTPTPSFILLFTSLEST